MQIGHGCGRLFEISDFRFDSSLSKATAVELPRRGRKCHDLYTAHQKALAAHAWALGGQKKLALIGIFIVHSRRSSAKEK
jgi:hypothetical protein